MAAQSSCLNTSPTIKPEYDNIIYCEEELQKINVKDIDVDKGCWLDMEEDPCSNCCYCCDCCFKILALFMES